MGGGRGGEDGREKLISFVNKVNVDIISSQLV